MTDTPIDIYLTPRFWKGELVYDGRRPLLVYENQEQKKHIDEEKPYPPQHTRKLQSQDGLIYEFSQLKNIKNKEKSVGVKMLICVTMYNERMRLFICSRVVFGEDSHWNL